MKFFSSTKGGPRRYRSVMSRASLGLVPCLLLAACSTTDGAGPPPGDRIFTDGSRLVAQTYSFPGTETLFAGIYNRVERTTCEFSTAADGKQRCLPDVYPTPEPVSRWVEGGPMPGPAAAGRLRRHDMVSADGGRFPSWWSLYDSRYGAPCVPGLVPDVDGTADGRCLPPHAVIVGNLFFADAGCTAPLALFHEDEQPFMIADANQALFAVAGAWQGLVYSGSATSCAEVDSSGFQLYSAGEPLPADAVASVRLVPQGTARLAVQMVEEAGERLTTVRFAEWNYLRYAGPYLDRELGFACRPVWTVADEVRCVPADAAHALESDELFLDPACTERGIAGWRLAVISRQDPATGRALAVEVRRLDDTRCSLTGFRREGGECMARVKGSVCPLGEVLPWTDYAKMDGRTGAEP